MRIYLHINGIAQPQGSKTVYNGRAVDANAAKLKPWRKSITKQVGEQLGDWQLTEAPMSVRLLFVLPRPKTVTRKHHTVKPDLDKLVRAVLDGITDTKAVWKDDSQVVLLKAMKEYTVDEPAHVRVILEAKD